ncbi:hypothetical protein [Streptomyces hainanensis]|uniref:Protein kinase domain-containing protein n=1 Tax=Streptomyces hainanensis TaxID=402648 RepID=A0A4R4SXX3_9ACTN|nr:hypothetical protein [Streptomyces hainanensis]TDC69171.1 hypothetical protein E1283_26370 [Streptomyces hainanensis]
MAASDGARTVSRHVPSMSRAGPARIELSTLAKGRKLGSGGQGTIWETDRTLNQGRWQAAYKEYARAITPDTDALERMVSLPHQVPSGTRRWLAGHLAWPVALVTDAGSGDRVTGFLMRQIPQDFVRTLDIPGESERPSGMQYLLNPDAYLTRVGIRVTPRQRAQLLLDLARTLARLHGMDIVCGDLSPNNVLFTLSPEPACFLIDCDSMVLRGSPVVPPVETPDWEVPPGEPKAAREGDLYKLALLAVRLFSGEQSGSDTLMMTDTDSELLIQHLAERGVRNAPHERPSAEDWEKAMGHAVSRTPASAPRRPSPSPKPSGGQRATRPATSPRPRPSPPPAPTPTPTPAPAPAPAPAPGTGWITPPSPPPVWARKPSRPQRPGPAGSSDPSCGGAVWVLAVICVVLYLVLQTFSAVWNGVGDAVESFLSGPEDEVQGVEYTPPTTARAQARDLDALLTYNSGTRGDVSEAVQELLTCPGVTPDRLAAAEDTFTTAAEDRMAHLESLDMLALDELPDGETLERDLREAWNASADADRAYALLADETWCDQDLTASPHWEDAGVANERATTAKRAFIEAWNPIAEQYDLTVLAWDDV